MQQQPHTVKAQYPAVDLMKFLLAIVVVSIHTDPFTGTALNEPWGMITRVAVPFFFLSSAFFLFRSLPLEKGFFCANRAAVWKTIRRILLLYLIASLVYLPISHLKFDGGILQLLSALLFKGVYSHLWFLPALALSILLTALLLQVFRTRAVFLIALLFYLVATLATSYHSLVIRSDSARQFYDALDGFMGDQNAFTYGFVFVALGAWIAQKKQQPNLRFCLCGAALGFAALAAEGFGVTHFRLYSGRFLFFSLLPLSYFLFTAALSLRITERRAYPYLRRMSTNIYVFHYFFIYFAVTALSIPKHSMTAFLFSSAASTLFALLVVLLSEKKKLHWLKYFY